MAWNLRSPRDFVLGMIALGGVVVTGILLFTVVPSGPTLPWTLGLVIGGALLFGAIVLLTRGIQGGKFPF